MDRPWRTSALDGVVVRNITVFALLSVMVSWTWRPSSEITPVAVCWFKKCTAVTAKAVGVDEVVKVKLRSSVIIGVYPNAGVTVVSVVLCVAVIKMD